MTTGGSVYRRSPRGYCANDRAIARAIRGGPAEYTVPWALAHATPHVCTQVPGQLPAPARLLYHRVWLPRFTRNTPPL